MNKRKSRKEKEQEYENKYKNIPRDYIERLSWLYDTLNLSDKLKNNILNKRNYLINNLYYYSTKIVLFEVPEGTPRPRFRLINRKNFNNMALKNPNFVHVYSPTGHEDQVFMKRMINEKELIQLSELIYTPCDISIDAYVKTPSSYSKTQIMLAEIGLDRPISKPDWDNIGKKYCDMFNKNIWLDDSFVVDGSVHKYYSVLPRIEIELKYLSQFYNKHQERQVMMRKEFLNV